MLHVLTYSTRLADNSSQGASENVLFYHNVPVRNPRFVGQKRYLSAISKAITNANTNPVRIALVGRPGNGKTQIAAEYCYRARNKFAAVLWINAGSEVSIRRSIEAVTDILPGSQKIFSSYNERTQYLSKYLQGTKKPWLLVLDDVENNIFIPPLGIAFSKRHQTDVVLITSRNLRVENYQSIKVNSMQENDARTLLQTTIEEGDIYQGEAMDTLLSKLEYMPLAITQIAAIINSSQRSLSSVLEMFDSKAVDYSAKISTILEFGIVELEKAGESGVLLLEFLCQSSYFSPDGISENFFKLHYYQCQELATVVPNFYNLFLNEGCWDEFRYQDAVTKLSSRAFASLDPGGDQGVTFHMHRVVQVRNL